MHLSLSSSVLQRLHFTSYIPTPSTQCAQRRPAEASGRSPAPRSTPCSFVSTRLLWSPPWMSGSCEVCKKIRLS
jgi:hypothetical protein